MRDIPVLADLCHKDGGSGAPTAEKRQIGRVCLVAGSPSIIEVLIEGIQCSCDSTLYTIFLFFLKVRSMWQGKL